MTKRACIKFFNADIREQGEQIEYEESSFLHYQEMRIIEFRQSATQSKIYNFDRIISITLTEDELQPV